MSSRQATVRVDFLVVNITEAETDATLRCFRPESTFIGPTSGRTYHLKGAQAPRGSAECWTTGIVRAQDQGHRSMASLIAAALREVNPAYIVVAGTGGGILSERDRRRMAAGEQAAVRLGTVVISRNVRYVAFGAADGHQFVPADQPHEPPSSFLRNVAQGILSTWSSCHHPGPVPPSEAAQPKPIEADVLAGESLEKGHGLSTAPTRFDLIIANYRDAAVVDMESGAVASVLYAERSTSRCRGYVVVRGVSDMVNVPGQNNDTVRNQWRESAALAAAEFAALLVDRAAKSFPGAGEEQERHPTPEVVLSSVEEVLGNAHVNRSEDFPATLNGLILRTRPVGGVVFLDLSDGSGVVQLKVDRGAVDPETFAAARDARRYQRVEVRGAARLDGRDRPIVLVTQFRLRGGPLPQPDTSSGAIQANTAAQVLVARLRRKASAYLETQGFLEIEPRLISRTWSAAGLQPLRAHYPGFGADLYLVPSPASQLLRALVVTGKDRVFCASRCFTWNFRDHVTSTESVILSAKMIGPEAETVRIAQEVVAAALDIGHDSRSAPRDSRVQWSPRSLTWPPATVSAGVEVPETQRFSIDNGVDPEHGQKHGALFRLCWPPQFVFVEGGLGEPAGGASLSFFTLHLERMVAWALPDDSQRIIPDLLTRLEASPTTATVKGNSWVH